MRQPRSKMTTDRVTLHFIRGQPYTRKKISSLSQKKSICPLKWMSKVPATPYSFLHNLCSWRRTTEVWTIGKNTELWIHAKVNKKKWLPDNTMGENNNKASKAKTSWSFVPCMLLLLFLTLCLKHSFASNIQNTSRFPFFRQCNELENFRLYEFGHFYVFIAYLQASGNFDYFEMKF